MRRANERMRKIGPLELQRDAMVGDVIRYRGGFGDSKPKCHACPSRMTARTPDRRWSCPWHWPVVQLVLSP